MKELCWKVLVTGLFTSLLLLGGCEDGDDGAPGVAGPAGPAGPQGPAHNFAPTVDAGADQAATGGTLITLSGTGDDSDGSISSYTWAQTSGTTVALTGSDTPTATFTAPASDTEVVLIFELSVTDDGGASTTDDITVTIGSPYEAADGINGGRLYSKFWADETGFTVTAAVASARALTQNELDVITSRSNFFRCKQCHGWDRLGREGGYSNRAPKTSRPNVADVNLKDFVDLSTSEEIFNAIKTGSAPRRDISTDLSNYDPAVDPSIGDMMPDYSQIFSDDEIWELVKYLKEESIDTTLLYDITLDSGVYPDRGRTFTNLGKDGDAANGDAVFAANCTGCHGADGTLILVDGGNYTLGGHVRSKPYEDQHKVKFGHLGSIMGSILKDSPDSDIVDLFKALTNTDKYPSDPAEFTAASGINGGRLYSKFWADETGFTLANSNLTDQAEFDAITSRSNFFRCKQCHGWDRLGREGGYSNRAPKTSRPNVADLDLAAISASSSSIALFNALKSGSSRRDISVDLSTYDPAVDPTTGDMMPDYSQIMSDEQIWDLVKYLKAEALDTPQLYDITLGDGAYPNRSRTFSNLGRDFDAVNGDALFAANCAGCHGADGTLLLVDGGGYTLGGHFRSKPYEDQHKVKFGHLGSIMGAILADKSLEEIGDLMKAVSDETKYPTAPAEFAGANGINGGRLYSKFWATETGFTLANSNLVNQAELDAITSRSDFFRCKQCHGWDRLGRLGGYSNRSPKTSRPNVADLDLAAVVTSSSAIELFDAIKSGSSRRDISTDLSTYDPAVDPTVGDMMPDYSQIFTDDQIWELVNFLQDEALDTTQLYDITLDDGVYPNRGRTFSDIGKSGNAANGDSIFAANCSGCHGDDGTLILVDGGAYTVGAHLRAKPYEDHHKVKFGNLGSTMGSILSNSSDGDVLDLFKALTDSTKYPD
jgi:mono/diheme cytochrome c family protein